MLWMGVVPIIAFVLLDSFADKKKALWGALFLGAGEVAFSLYVIGGLDYLSLLAFAFLALFIFASLKTKNDVYFKSSGALMNLFFAVVLLGAKFLFDKNIFLDMAIKYKMIEMLRQSGQVVSEEWLAHYFTVVNQQLPWWLIGHSVLVIYAALKWNKWLWMAIRVPGFYVMLMIAGVIMARTA